MVEAMPYGCATWTLRPEVSDSLRCPPQALAASDPASTVRRELASRLFRTYMWWRSTSCESLKTSIRKGQRHATRLSKIESTKEASHPLKHGGNRLKEGLRAIGVFAQKGARRN